MSFGKALLVVLVVVLLVVGGYVAGMWLQLYGVHEGPGEITQARVPEAEITTRGRSQQSAASSLRVKEPKQILFGDFHVHSTFSTDAFLSSLPMLQGDGAHPIADACDYARFCSAIDFWSINDHAEASTPRRWAETRQSIRQCNAVSGNNGEPDVAAFLGWEWSQVGFLPEDHYGHKNVIFYGLEDDEVPPRPIGAAGLATDALRGIFGGVPRLLPLLDFRNRQRYYNFNEFMREIREIPHCPRGVDSRQLPADCYESAATPGELFEKLSQLGFETIVIPHGNTWGFYSPPGTSLDKQLAVAQHDPSKQILFEIMSGHGNSEEYRDWQAVRFDDDGKAYCPEPTSNYLPSCWRAGEIIEERCLSAGLDAAECASRALEARQNYVDTGVGGHHTVTGEDFEEWLDSGQCKDCFLPSFNYRPRGSAQYALAISNLENPAEPKRFRFGFIASSDNHQASPGTGYKEFDRRRTTEAKGEPNPTWRRRLAPEEKPEPRSIPRDTGDLSQGFRVLERERQASFFMTGGLAAVHANGRSRREIWNALERKEVYGTSGDRILLWFDLVNAELPGGQLASVPMGQEVQMTTTPRFLVRAVGAFKQNPGCPESSVSLLGAERLQWLCRGECYNPSDERKLITRIEVVRIRPQISADEPVAGLIEDPWRVFQCPSRQAGCAVAFDDPEFLTAGRDTVYYVRAVEEPSLAINGANLRCRYDDSGRCVEVNPCYGDYRTNSSDDCTSPVEERAWSSPIFIDVGSIPQPDGEDFQEEEVS